MKIKVTTQDIMYGERVSPYRCPIALAARRAGLEAVVSHRYLRAENPEGHSLYNLPWRAMRFIKRYDDGKRVRPFTFKLRKPL